MTVNSLSSPFSSQLKVSEFRYTRQPVQSSKQENLERSRSSSKTETRNDELSRQRELQQLKNRDMEVRAHELAHVSVGARYITSGAQFQYQKGPDGRMYAVGGEVSIDTSPIPGDPGATIRKAQVIARAAMAPATPSAQDRMVATRAAALIQQSRAELALQNSRERAPDSADRLDVFA